MASGGSVLSEWWNRFLASDPALRRLRTAARVTLAVVLALAVAVPLLAWWGQQLPSAMIGAVVAINGSLGVTDPDRRGQAITYALLPIPVLAALGLAIGTQFSPPLHSAVFLVVIFVAVYVRRFGPRFFPLGMVAFMGYFVAMFLRPHASQFPAMLVAVLLGTLAAAGVRFLVLRDDPDGVLARGLRTMRAQVHGLLHAVRDVADQPDSGRRRRELRNRAARLNETSLMLENTVDRMEELSEAGRAALHQRILDVELAAENLVTRLLQLVDHPSGGGAVPHAVGPLLSVLERRPEQIRDAVRRVSEQVEAGGAVDLAMSVRRLGTGLAELADATGELGERAEDEAKSDGGPDEADEEPTGLARPELRTAIQVTVAAGLAILLGQLVSPNRWYWAVITAFVVFISANSRGELLVRAWQRTAGTLLGVLAGILVAANVGGDLPAELVVILLCVFLAFYFVGYSYAAMTFFITTLLGALYGMLGTFDASVLETRLAETAVGALAGVLAAVFVLPTRTREVVRTRTAEFLEALRDFLRSTGTELSEHGTATDSSTRALDDALQRVLTSSAPLTSYRLRSRRSQVQRVSAQLGGCAYYVRNLSVALGDSAEMVDADTRQRLAEHLWALADAADSLTGDSPIGGGVAFEEAIAAAHRCSNVLHDLAESLTDGPTSLHRCVRYLDRTTQVLDEMAREIGAEPHLAERS